MLDLDETAAAAARIVVLKEPEPEGENDMVGVPEAWKTFEDGTPQPQLGGAAARVAARLALTLVVDATVVVTSIASAEGFKALGEEDLAPRR